MHYYIQNWSKINLMNIILVGNKWIYYQEQVFKKPCKDEDRKPQFGEESGNEQK